MSIAERRSLEVPGFGPNRPTSCTVCCVGQQLPPLLSEEIQNVNEADLILLLRTAELPVKIEPICSLKRTIRRKPSQFPGKRELSGFFRCVNGIRREYGGQSKLAVL